MAMRGHAGWGDIAIGSPRGHLWLAQAVPGDRLQLHPRKPTCMLVV